MWCSRDISWCGGLSEALKIYTIAEAAGIPTILHGGCNSPFGQHFSLAMPESPFAEYWLGTDPGIPLEELRPIPGMSMPRDGKLVPNDAPGFGMDIKADWIRPYSGPADSRCHPAHLWISGKKGCRYRRD